MKKFSSYKIKWGLVFFDLSLLDKNAKAKLKRALRREFMKCYNHENKIMLIPNFTEEKHKKLIDLLPKSTKLHIIQVTDKQFGDMDVVYK